MSYIIGGFIILVLLAYCVGLVVSERMLRDIDEDEYGAKPEDEE